MTKKKHYEVSSLQSCDAVYPGTLADATLQCHQRQVTVSMIRFAFMIVTDLRVRSGSFVTRKLVR